MTYRWRAVVAAVALRTAVVLAPEVGSADDVRLGDLDAQRRGRRGGPAEGRRLRSLAGR